MAKGMLHRLVGVFMDASRDLKIQCENIDMERLAVIIHRVMSYQSRQFHTLEHVFSFIDRPGVDHETVFAAAFHDLVYYQVDDGLAPELEAVLGSFFTHDGKSATLAQIPPYQDSAWGDCLAVFGFVPGQVLQNSAGLNEFLSALAMMKMLEPYVQRPLRISVATCIEATIPFRGLDEKGRGIGERLESRLLDPSNGFNLDAASVQKMVRRAIDIANVDVKNFSISDPGLFLSDTWKLLPESNSSLRTGGSYSLREYRIALQKMLGFFRFLDPKKVYHQYRNFPDGAEMSRLEEGTAKNLALAKKYMLAKLLAITLVETIAELSGGDVPIPLFLGDLPAGNEKADGITDLLPPLAVPAWIRDDDAVYHLLKDGRLDDSSFDLKNSPLALYLYLRLDPETWIERTKAADEYFSGKLTPLDFLKGFDGLLLGDFLKACVEMVPSRAESLRGILASFET